MFYPIIDIKKTGLNIKNLCIDNNITIKELQDYMGFSCPQSIYHWFSGRALPAVDNLFALSKLLNIPVEQILVERLFIRVNIDFEFQNRRLQTLFFRNRLRVYILLLNGYLQ